MTRQGRKAGSTHGSDSFFAFHRTWSKAGVLTQEVRIYSRLFEIAKGWFRNETLPKRFPSGFDVTIGNRTITVIPIPGTK